MGNLDDLRISKLEATLRKFKLLDGMEIDPDDITTLEEELAKVKKAVEDYHNMRKKK